MTRIQVISLSPQRWAWLLGSRAQRPILALSVPLISLAVLLFSAWQWQSARHRLSHIQDSAALSTQRLALTEAHASESSAGALTLTASKRAKMNVVIRQLNAPWFPVLNALEVRELPDVNFVSIESDAEKGSVRVQIEGKQVDDLLRFADHVGKAESFSKSRLLQAEAPSEPESASAVPRLTFDLEVAK